jgi:hypothetical protein
MNDNKYLEKIKHDIRNLKQLTPKQLDFIMDLPNNEKYKIIKIYNEIMIYVIETFKLLDD